MVLTLRCFRTYRAIYGNEHPLKFGMIKPKDGFAIYQDSGVAYSYIIVDRIRRKEIFSGPSSEVFEKEYDVVHYITGNYRDEERFAPIFRIVRWICDTCELNIKMLSRPGCTFLRRSSQF